MGFFDGLGGSLAEKGREAAGLISSKSKDVAQKAKEMSEVAGLKSLISASEKAINQAYMDIGTKYYQKMVQEGAPDDFAGEFNIIKENLAKIADVKKQIENVKGEKNCPSCGKPVALGSAFCGYCGTRMDDGDAEGTTSPQGYTASEEAATETTDVD